MIKKILKFAFLLFLIIVCCISNYIATKYLFKNQPEWYFLRKHSFKKFTHILSAAMGFRAVMADFEYIYFLQYYGDPANKKERYIKLYSIFDSITDIDPHFIFTYTFGSAILAFDVKRYDEAISLIKKGLKYNPTFWRLRLYLGAIVYKELDDKEKYVSYLEEALKYDDHPAMIERILGHIYEQYKTPDEIVSYWVKIYKTTRDKETRQHAYKKIIHYIEKKKIKNPESILEQIK
ncbi:MAG: hypothetical protein N2114_01770 [Candidatus Goldbacteria bacterium]|nr:hypothetical protein [Candidatus Goldiibacteriota bacterium]